MTAFRYQIYNSQWQAVPHEPFLTVDEAERYIRSLLETYPGPFYVVELRIVAELK
jgi:hypothetical protein